MGKEKEMVEAFSSWDRGQIGIKFQIKGLKVLSLACNVYFTDQNIMQKGESMELNFEVFEM